MRRTLNFQGRPSVIDNLEAGLFNSDDDDYSNKCLCDCHRVTYWCLLALALLAMVTYGLATMALLCRVHSVAHANIVLEKSYNSTEPDTICAVHVLPFRYLYEASNIAIVLTQFLAALLLIQSLMLKSRVLPNKANRRSLETRLGVGFPSTEREPCHLHPQDFILRLTYRTRCQDDWIIRVQIPTNTVPLPTSMMQMRTYDLLAAKQKDQQLIHEIAVGRAGAAYKIPISLMDTGPLEIDGREQGTAESSEHPDNQRWSFM